MSGMDALRSDAAKLLRDGAVKMVVGYRARGDQRVPAFLTDPDKADALTYDADCKQNLAAYLRKPEVRRHLPLAIVAPPNVCRSLVLLAAESQLIDGEVKVLAVGNGQYHGVLDVAGVAALLKEKYPDLAPSEELVRKIGELAAMSPERRGAFWMEQFERCTRCYACRAACPGCYCTRCIVEKNVPQWISTAAAPHGNYAWNIIRAFHLAGRCTLCGACEAACPQGLPLMLLNVRVAQDVEEEFGAKAGYDPAAKPVIGSWSPDDDDEYMR